MRFSPITSTACIPLCLSGFLLSSQAVAGDESIITAIKNGEAKLGFRLRHETVDQDNALSDTDAQALTLRARLSYKTDRFKGVQAFLEMDNITAINDNYNSTVNGKTSDATVADPEGTEFNQAYIDYQLAKATNVKWGRQRITLDNHRFVGHVGWRQNEQTYDAFSITSTRFSNTKIFAGRIGNVNRIFGESSLVGDVDMGTNLLNVGYDGLSAGNITAYAYQIDGEPSTAQTAASKNFNKWDTATYGIRFSGSRGDKTKFHYSLEYAIQSDTKDNPASYDADYYSVEAGLTVSGITLMLGEEVLGADGTDGFFITPLATLHKFQGWTDKFLNNGVGNLPGGIEDTYFSIGGSVSGIKLLAVHHEFEADDRAAAGMSSYGSETGFLAAKKFGMLSMAFKYANYNADSFSSDTTKLWLTAAVQF